MAVKQQLTFGQYNKEMQKHIASMLKENNVLYTVTMDKDAMWETYLNAFPPGTNEVYRKRREFDCSCCRHFVKRLGNVLSIKNGTIQTIWDFESKDNKYFVVNATMAALIERCPIENVFLTPDATIGQLHSLENNKETGKVVEWDHFACGGFPTTAKANIGTKLGEYTAQHDVFQRSLSELTMSAVETVLDMISQNSLYKGEEWKAQLEKFLAYQKAFDKLKSNRAVELFCWEKCVEAGPVVSRIRNTSIGTLLVDLSAGMDLDEAVVRYEKVTAPTNYKRPKEIFTKKMVEDAEKVLVAEGLLDSLPRRYAVLEDITVNNILFANRDSMKQIKGSVLDALKQEVPTRAFGKAEALPIADFIKDVLPNVSYMEALLENKHSGNLVSLIAPQNMGSKTLFKWNNGFSWAYNGNVTDSMKERVKAAGGNVEGCLRFSIQWNEDKDNQNDFDAHCMLPGDHIYFGQKRGLHSSHTGALDVDIIHPDKKVAIENIIFTDARKMPEGNYRFCVNNFTDRGGRSGFRAEVEFDGQCFQFDYPHPVQHKADVEVATVEYKKLTGFHMVKSMESQQAVREVWGLKTSQMHPVSVLMYSPNYWDEQDGIGHRHYFFMLKNCRSTETPNGFFNEYIREDYVAKYKRVFAALGSKTRVEPADNQLSGLGFSATKRAELTVKVDGKFSRTLALKF